MWLPTLTCSYVKVYTSIYFVALPADTALTVKMNGFPISGTSAYPAKVKVGDEVELECYSKLGSIQNTEIEWWKTSSVGDITEQIQQNNVKFIKYNPGVFGSNGVETSGPIRDLDAECSRDQTTTLRYNVSKADQVRGIVAFKCYVQVTPPVSGSSPNVQLDPVIVNSTSFYMEIGMLNTLFSFSADLNIVFDKVHLFYQKWHIHINLIITRFIITRFGIQHDSKMDKKCIDYIEKWP